MARFFWLGLLGFFCIKSAHAQTIAAMISAPNGLSILGGTFINDEWHVELGGGVGVYSHPIGELKIFSLQSHVSFLGFGNGIRFFGGVGGTFLKLQKSQKIISRYEEIRFNSQVRRDTFFFEAGSMIDWYEFIPGFTLGSGFGLIFPIWWRAHYQTDLDQLSEDARTSVWYSSSYWQQKQKMKRVARRISGFDRVSLYILSLRANL